MIRSLAVDSGREGGPNHVALRALKRVFILVSSLVTPNVIALEKSLQVVRV